MAVDGWMSCANTRRVSDLGINNSVACGASVVKQSPPIARPMLIGVRIFKASDLGAAFIFSLTHLFVFYFCLSCSFLADNPLPCDIGLSPEMLMMSPFLPICRGDFYGNDGATCLNSPISLIGEAIPLDDYCDCG